MSVQSVQRAFKILDALAMGPSGVSDLARRTSLPKSTVARLLSTLEEAGAVERGPEAAIYRVGTSIRSLATSALGSKNLVALARPTLDELASELGEAAGLSVADGYNVHYISQVEAENAIQVRDWTGELVPMHLVPSGQVMLAEWPEDRLTRYLERPLLAMTEHSLTEPKALRRRIAEIRQQGYSWVKEEFAEGIDSVAAPVHDAGRRVVGAIHVHGPAYRFPAPGAELAVGRTVVAAAESLSHSVGRLGG